MIPGEWLEKDGTWEREWSRDWLAAEVYRCPRDWGMTVWGPLPDGELLDESRYETADLAKSGADEALRRDGYLP